MDLAQLLSISQAARILGVSWHTIWRLLQAGQLESVRVGRRRLIPRSALERLLTTGCPSPACPSREVHRD
jgi:excisionase family DNA binding protein